jgi:O-antigen/teichoic acid export membrane protein
VSGAFSVEAAIAAWLVGRIVGALLSVALARRSVGLARGAAIIRSALRPAFGYGLRAYAASLSALPIRRFDTFMLAAIGPSSQLGLYTAGVNIAEVAMYLPNSVANVMLPEGAGRTERESALLTQQASAVVSLIMVVGATVGILAAPFIVRFVFGPDFAGSVVPFQLMMIAMVGSSVRRIYSAGLMARNRAGLVSVLTLATMLLIVALDLILIPGSGASGAALASALGYTAGGILVYVMYRRSLSDDVVRTLPPLRSELALGVASLRQRITRRAAGIP